MAIDFTTNVGRLRLRTADISDLPYLPDAVYEQVLVDENGNLPRAAKVLATYILGILSHKTHRKLNQLEVWGSEAFSQYKQFLLLTVTNPAFMDISPIPVNVGGTDLHPLIEFQKDWNANYVGGTQSEQLALDAIGNYSTSLPTIYNTY